MSAASQALKQARQEVLAGGDRQAIFQKYRDQVSRPIKLATVISSVPREPIQALARILNTVLLVFLVLAAILKMFGIAALLGAGAPPVALIVVIFLGLIVPVVFIIGVARWEGQMYSLLPIFCLLGILQSWLKSPPLDAAIATAFLLVIGGLAIAVKRLAFPQLGWLGVKRDAAGQYVF